MIFLILNIAANNVLSRIKQIKSRVAGKRRKLASPYLTENMSSLYNTMYLHKSTADERAKAYYMSKVEI